MYKEWLEWAEENRAENTMFSQGSAIRQWLGMKVDGKPVGMLDIGEVKPKHVMEYINRKDGVSLSQRKFRLSSINSLTSLAKERGHAKGNPAAKLRVNMKKLTHKQKEKKVRLPFTRAEYDCVTDQARIIAARYGDFFRAATALSYWTGLRLSDCACLEWDALITEPGHIVVWTAKAGDKQHARVALPLDDPLIGGEYHRGNLTEVLNELTMDDPVYVFPEERGLITNVNTRSHLPQYYIRMLKRMGIKNKSFHCLRHTFVTRLKAAGKTLEEIGKLVAHSDEATTGGYVHE